MGWIWLFEYVNWVWNDGYKFWVLQVILPVYMISGIIYKYDMTCAYDYQHDFKIWLMDFQINMYNALDLSVIKG